MQIEDLMIHKTADSVAMLEVMGEVSHHMESVQEHEMWTARNFEFRNPPPIYPPNENPRFAFSVREPDEKLMGYVEIHESSQGWFIARLWVKKSFRRKKIGQLLLRLALDEVALHSDTAYIYCHFDNFPSLNLQLGMGFRIVPNSQNFRHHLLEFKLNQ